MTTFLTSFVTPAMAIYLVNLAVAAVLISSIGLLTAAIFSKQSAPVRHAILVSTLVLTLLAPVLTWWACRNGWGRIAIAFAEPAARPLTPAPDAAPVNDLAEKAGPDTLPSDAALPALPFALRLRKGASQEDTRATMTEPDAPQAIAPQPKELPASPPAAVSWQHVAVALAAWGWLLGTLIGAGRVARGFLVLRRFRRSLETPSLKHLDQAAREAAEAFGVVEAASRRLFKAAGCRFHLPPIRISAMAPAPLSLGLVHPLIVLPSHLAEKSDAEQLRAILVHEMAHIVHRHHWIGLMQWLAGIIFWWNPFLHRVNRGILQLREEICDDHVLQSDADGREFARVLVDLAARLTDLPRIPATLAILETGYSDFQHRITNLLDKERTIVTRMTRKAMFSVMLFGLAILLVVPLAGLRAEEKSNAVNAPTKPDSGAADPIATSEMDPAAAQRPSSVIHTASANAETVVAGQVVDSEGKPIAGAQVAVTALPRGPWVSIFLANSSTILGLTNADGDGRFHLKVPEISSAAYYNAAVVAAAPGFNFGGHEIGLDIEQPNVTISLTTEQSIRGQVVDANNEPIASAEIRVGRICFDGLAGWVQCPDASSQPPFWPKPATTDRQGYFALRGVDRTRGVSVQIHDERFAATDYWIAPVDKVGKANNARSGVRVSSSGEVTLSPPPSRICEGEITYGDTHQPVASARVEIGVAHDVPGGVSYSEPGGAGMTNVAGRFRLNLLQGKTLDITVYPPDGESYLIFQKKIDLADGEQPPKIAIALPRGVLLQGKVVEKASGRPIAGAILQFYEYPRSGYYAPERTLTPNQSPLNARVATKADGTFAIAAPPGFGLLLIQGPGGDFIRQEVAPADFQIHYGDLRRHYVSAYVPLDLKIDQEPAALNIALRRGVAIRGRVVGPDDRPVDDVGIVSRHFHGFNNEGEAPIRVKDGQFELHGLDREVGVPFYFLDAKNRLGAMVEISGKSADAAPLVIHLQPCGKAVARFVDSEGKPRAKQVPFAALVVSPERIGTAGKHSPDVFGDVESMGNFFGEHNGVNQLTDDNGTFTFSALIPGATYQVALMGESYYSSDVPTFSVKSAETLQLPDVTFPEPNGESTTRPSEKEMPQPAEQAKAGKNPPTVHPAASSRGYSTPEEQPAVPSPAPTPLADTGADSAQKVDAALEHPAPRGQGVVVEKAEVIAIGTGDFVVIVPVENDTERLERYFLSFLPWRMAWAREELHVTDRQEQQLVDMLRHPEPYWSDQKQRNEATQRTSRKLQAILLPKQIDRAQEIALQMEGASACFDADIIRALELTNDQRTEMRAIYRESMKANLKKYPAALPSTKYSAAVAPPSLSNEQQQALFEQQSAVEKTVLEKFLKLLSSEQRAKYEKMIGKKIDRDRVLKGMQVEPLTQPRVKPVYAPSKQNGDVRQVSPPSGVPHKIVARERLPYNSPDTPAVSEYVQPGTAAPVGPGAKSIPVASPKLIPSPEDVGIDPGKPLPPAGRPESGAAPLGFPASDAPYFPSEAAEAMKVLLAHPPAAEKDRIEAAIVVLRSSEMVDASNGYPKENAMRELIRIGKPAVPRLAAELDRAKNDRLFRAFGFVLRGIGDPRAAPALMRAIPRLPQLMGGDYVFTISNDPELLKFMQDHDDAKVLFKEFPEERDKYPGHETNFSYGSPSNEIMPALQEITGDKRWWFEFEVAQLDNSAEHHRLRRLEFQKLAVRWDEWWEKNWRKFVKDEGEAQIEPTRSALAKNASELARLTPQPLTEIPSGKDVHTDGEGMFAFIISFDDPRRLYRILSCLDLDTGRMLPPPQELVRSSSLGMPSPALLSWAEKEGVNLIGMKFRPQGSEQSYFAFQPLNMKVWRVDNSLYDHLATELQKGAKLDLPGLWEGPIASLDEKTGQIDESHPASFLFLTKRGICGAIRVQSKETYTFPKQATLSSEIKPAFEIQYIYRSEKGK